MTSSILTKLATPEIAEILFRPLKTTPPDRTAQSENVSVFLDTAKLLLGCRLHSNQEISSLIVLFHGSHETVQAYDLIADRFLQHHMGLFVVTYRGYGWSTGSPNITNFFTDLPAIQRAISSLIADRFSKLPVFIMGRSLGSVRAIEILHHYPENFKGLLLESAFADTPSFLKNLGCDLNAQSLDDEDCFQNIDRIKEIEKPTLVLHGSNDQLVSLRDAEKLQSFSGAKTKQFYVIPGANHDNLVMVGEDLYFETIKKFIDTVVGSNTWRQRRKRFNSEKR